MVEEISLCTPDGHLVTGSLLRANKEKGFALLVHGITADRHEWGLFDFLSEELHANGISSLAIDYRGHGKSMMSIEQLSLCGVLLDIQTAWQYVEKTCNDLNVKRFIVGNSFGGGLAYLFSQIYRKVDAVFLTCPVTSYISDLNRVTTDWRSSLVTGFVPYASKKLAASTVTEMYTFDELIENCVTRIPLTVIHGTADSDVPFDESSHFVSKRSRLATLHPLEGMDHSFSAPEGLPDREELSRQYRKQASIVIANIMCSYL